MSQKKTTFKAFFLDRESHKCVLSIDLTSDGYMTALADAHKICADNYSHLYVGQVTKV